MALQERHRWVMSKILEAFAPELPSELVQSFMRQDANLQKLNSFFKGDGPGRMFVFFQAEVSEGEVKIINEENDLKMPTIQFLYVFIFCYCY